MIRRGKVEGWLALPASAVDSWSAQHQIRYPKLSVGNSAEGKGSGLVAASSAGLIDEDNPIIFVPNQIIIYPKTLEQRAQHDSHLREVLTALGDFGKTPRGAILASLLMSVTYNCPDIQPKIGQPGPLTEYIKFLPLEHLPTLWSPEELKLLAATTLAPAIEAKIRKLTREFDLLRKSTKSIPWCEKHWWNSATGLLTFEDWKHVDAMYRSRALEIDGIGHCMIPIIDMANHACGSHVDALYGNDDEDNAILMLRFGRTLAKGDEVAVPYGEEKGACEMVFSYGFIDSHETSAKTLFLGLDVPDDDPLKLAKISLEDIPPGFRIIDEGQTVGWEGVYVWLICINEEDGLGFTYKRLENGEPELILTWNQYELEDPSRLEGYLRQSELWDVYQLRAVSMLKGRVEQQLQRIQDVASASEASPGAGTTVGEKTLMTTTRLRTLEMELLQKCLHQLGHQMADLLNSEVVLRYLGEDTSELVPPE